MHMSQVENALEERERLKNKIEVATANRSVGGKNLVETEEIRGLREFAKGLQTYLRDADEPTVERWLRGAYDLAMRDGELSQPEREAIISIAASYNWDRPTVVGLLERWSTSRV